MRREISREENISEHVCVVSCQVSVVQKQLVDKARPRTTDY
jgi:hypothetical protein